MFTILAIGVAAALAVFFVLTKTGVAKPKKAAKSEKAAIMKQLLAMSDGENCVSASASSPSLSGSPRSVSTSAPRSDSLRKSTYRQHESKQKPSKRKPSPMISTSSSSNQIDGETEEKIRQRAYELYRKRGGVEGNPADDWLQATKDVLSRKAKAGSTSP
jgi:Protein of unknown function (DUF2934)